MEIRARTEIVQTSAVNDELVLLQLKVTPNKRTAFASFNTVRSEPLQVGLLMRVLIVMVISDLIITVINLACTLSLRPLTWIIVVFLGCCFLACKRSWIIGPKKLLEIRSEEIKFAYLQLDYRREFFVPLYDRCARSKARARSRWARNKNRFGTTVWWRWCKLQ